jgi:hypothetical protein
MLESFLEWTYDYTNDKFPYFYHKKECYPTAKQMDDFISVYLSRTNADMTKAQEKQQLLEEISLFTLASHMFWGIWGIVNINQDIEFGYWVRNFLKMLATPSSSLVPRSRNMQIFESANISPPKKNI